MAAGGGILIGNHVWDWSGPQASAPVNLLLSPMGIIVSSSFVMGDSVLDPTTPPSQEANVESGLDCLEATLRDNNSGACGA